MASSENQIRTTGNSDGDSGSRAPSTGESTPSSHSNQDLTPAEGAGLEESITFQEDLAEAEKSTEVAAAEINEEEPSQAAANEMAENNTAAKSASWPIAHRPITHPLVPAQLKNQKPRHNINSSQEQSPRETADGSTPALISQELGIKEQDMHIYRSDEILENISRKKLVCPDGRKNHIWERTVQVCIKRKKGVKVRMFLSPQLVNTVLDIKVNVKSGLLRHMQQCAENCWVRVDLVMEDRSAGREIARIQGHLHPISLDEGQLSFCEVLASHETVKSSACSHVTLQIKITVVIAVTPCENYTVDEEDDKDGFAMVNQA